MTEPHETAEDREPAATPELENTPELEDTAHDVEGHVYTGALQDKNQQP